MNHPAASVKPSAAARAHHLLRWRDGQQCATRETTIGIQDGFCACDSHGHLRSDCVCGLRLRLRSLRHRKSARAGPTPEDRTARQSPERSPEERLAALAPEQDYPGDTRLIPTRCLVLCAGGRMRVPIPLLSIVPCCAALVTTGCATTVHRQYPGRTMPKSEVATIVLKTISPLSPVNVSKINGVAPRVDASRLRNESLLYGVIGLPLFGGPGVLHWAMNVNPRVVEVLPGRYDLEVGYSEPIEGTDRLVGVGPGGAQIHSHQVFESTFPKQLRFDAAAGRKYRIDGNRDGMEWKAYIEDTTDREGRVVGSTADGEAKRLAEGQGLPASP